MEVIEYTDEYFDKWNDFCMNESVNGTFLQTKKFLNYHPKERFEDASLLFLEKGNIIAICPACCIREGNEKIFNSHKGSTYGGLVIKKKYYKTEKLLDLINLFETYLVQKEYTKIILKITPDILQCENSELLQFCLLKRGYIQDVFLNTYIDFEHYKDNILSNFEQGKRTNVNNCIKYGLVTKPINTREEIEVFYAILCETLSKYHRLPIHTLEEIVLLKDKILKQEMGLFGAYKDGEMVAGSMMFFFEKAKCAHAQYLAAKSDYNKLSPMTYMYYSMIEKAKQEGYRLVSWGISSEHDGSINYGLTRNKEAYGSFHSLNRIFSKMIKT